MDDIKKNMTYEMFIRNAFKVKSKGDDPAHLGNSDIFSNCKDNDEIHLAELKVGAGYAMAIFSAEISNDNPDLIEECEKMLANLIKAKNKESVYDIITEYNKNIRKIES